MEQASDGLQGQLPRGRHGLSRAYVAESQRRRLLAAMSEVAAKRGYAGTTLRRLASAAEVAPNTLYDHFADIEECFLATVEDGVQHASEEIARASVSADEWPRRIRDGLNRLLGLVEADPALARVCLVEVMSAGPRAVALYEQLIAQLLPVFREGRELMAKPVDSEAMEETIVRGVAFLLSQRLIFNRAEGVTRMLPEMLEFIFIPYMGRDAARRWVEKSQAAVA